MKRREFLTAAAMLALIGGDAWAAKKKAPPKKKVAAPVRKKPSGPVAHTAEAPVIDRPPQGSSASRLPPVKAPEPPTDWMSYEITTTLTPPKTRGVSRLWLPLPLNQDSLYQRTVGHRWSSNADSAGMRRLPDGNLELFFCEWKNGRDAKLELTTTVSTADRHFDVTRRTIAPERDDILHRNLQASLLIPNDGPAHTLGERIVGRIKDPVAQVKAIYDWVIDNTIYNPELPAGSGGDVRKQLAQGQYGGRSADINGLFVALCRAIGIPARCVYGLRVGSSRLFKSLGINDENATNSQHCRAEFYVPGYGWIPVDPSDVRRAIAMEGLSDRDSKLGALKRVLFGVWEMNWIALNVGSDLTLPGSLSHSRLPMFTVPRLENDDNGETAPLQFAIKAKRVEI